MAMCERFGCLPDRLYEQDVELIRMARIEALGRKEDDYQHH